MRQLCPEWSVSDIRFEQYLSGGYRNRNYRVSYKDQRYVLRVADLSSAMNFRLERDRLASLSRLFPVCDELTLGIAPVAATHVERGLLLTSWNETPLLAETAGVTADTLGTYLALLHETLERLPDACVREEPAGDSRAEAQTAANFEPRAQIRQDLITACHSEQLAAELLEKVPLPTSRRRICHLDLNPWNLLTDGKLWVTLDWETVSEADPMFDLVSLCDGYLQSQNLALSKEAFSQSALRAYNHRSKRSSAEGVFGDYTEEALAEARTVFQWREYAWAAAQVARNNVRDEVVAQRDGFAQLLREQGINVLPG